MKLVLWNINKSSQYFFKSYEILAKFCIHHAWVCDENLLCENHLICTFLGLEYVTVEKTGKCRR
jgi:hypothetical protein